MAFQVDPRHSYGGLAVTRPLVDLDQPARGLLAQRRVAGRRQVALEPAGRGRGGTRLEFQAAQREEGVVRALIVREAADQRREGLARAQRRGCVASGVAKREQAVGVELAAQVRESSRSAAASASA